MNSSNEENKDLVEEPTIGGEYAEYEGGANMTSDLEEKEEFSSLIGGKRRRRRNRSNRRTKSGKSQRNHKRKSNSNNRKSKKNKKGGKRTGIIETAAVPFGILALQHYAAKRKTRKSRKNKKH